MACQDIFKCSLDQFSLLLNCSFQLTNPFKGTFLVKMQEILRNARITVMWMKREGLVCF